MKKIDKLVLGAFLGPFLMTFLVVVFILLTQHMLKYFDDIIGKGLGWDVIGQLLFYFAIFMTPVALPLAVLLSALIAFGNLGEHFELTAIKSAGISLVRTLQPIFFFVLILTGIAFYANNNLVPKAALEAYSLLYDIKQKKPALDLREGAFYNGINDISIKVDKKFPNDEAALKNIIVYDHRKNDGNKEVTVADSGRMYTILNERYLKFELYNGYNYTQGASSDRELAGQSSGTNAETLSRTRFNKSQVIFDLSSFKLERTDKKWFQGNRIMRNLTELNGDVDSMRREILSQQLNYYQYRPTFFNFYRKGDSYALPQELEQHKRYRDSIMSLPYRDKMKAPTAGPNAVAEAPPAQSDPKAGRRRLMPDGTPEAGMDTLEQVRKAKEAHAKKQAASKVYDSTFYAKVDSVYAIAETRDNVQGAANQARQVKSQIANANSSVNTYTEELRIFDSQWHKILASSLACVAMFLIGAPLGAIIKKGGLGVPFLVSILFFIIYYVVTMQGEKLAKQGTVSVAFGVWMADVILFVVGIIFLRQARADARLFEADFYSVIFDKVKRWISSRRQRHVAAS